MKFLCKLRRTIFIFGLSFSITLLAAQPVKNVESELLYGARGWIGKYRPDIARDLIEKLLSINPGSADGLFLSGELYLNENNIKDAQNALDILKRKYPGVEETRNLELMFNTYTVDKEKLAQMRLLFRAGRKEEAAQVAGKLFANGAPTLGSLAKEYFQVMGASSTNYKNASEKLSALYAETGNPSYRLNQIEIQLNHEKVTEVLMAEIVTLSNQEKVDQLKLKELWRRAISQTGNSQIKLSGSRAFLAKYPHDSAMVETLAVSQRLASRSGKPARDPLSVVRKAMAENDLELADTKLESLLSKRPNDADTLGTLGVVRLRQGRHLDALDFFNKANFASPSAKWQQLAKTAEFWGFLRQTENAMAEKDWGAATKSAEKAIAAQPEKLEGLLKLAEIKELSGDTESAEILYKKILEIEPDEASALQSLAILLNKKGQSREAIDLLVKAGGNSPILLKKLSSTKSKIIQSQADSFVESNQYAEAMRLLQTALITSPNDVWLRFKTAKLYQKMDQDHEALVLMDEGVKLDDQDDEMHFARALVRGSLGNFAGVIEDLEKIPSKQQSQSMKALLMQAKINELIAEAKTGTTLSDQEKLLQKAEVLAGDDTNNLSAVANAWFALEKPHNGIKIFEALERRQSQLSPEAQLQYTLFLNRAKSYDLVDQKLTTLLANLNWNQKQELLLLDLFSEVQVRKIEEKKKIGDSQAVKAMAYAPVPGESAGNASARNRARSRLMLAAEDYQQAIELLQESLTIYPDDVSLRTDLAQAFIKTQSFPQAYPHIQWLSLHVPRGNIYERLAVLRLWQVTKHTFEARREADQLLLDHPAHLEVILSVARFERSQGDYSKALALYNKARIIDANQKAVAATKPEVVELNLNHEVVGNTPKNLRNNEIQQSIQLIEEKQLAWVEVGLKRLQKTSSSGISSLNGWERTAAISYPYQDGGRVFFRMDQVDLNAGDLPSININNQLFGQISAKPQISYSPDVLSQKSNGVNLGAGYENDGLRFDFGFIGIGMPVSNFVGGLSKNFKANELDVSLGVSRRPQTSSLLAYAGAIDPVTNQAWGGVVATGLNGRVATEYNNVALSFEADYAALTGKNVENNTRLRIRFAADQLIYSDVDQNVSLGLTASAWRFAQDLSGFTWGQGGYYSPQRYMSFSVPVEWNASQGLFSWQARLVASVARKATDASLYFPTDSILQNASINKFKNPSSSSGTGFSFSGALEYELNSDTKIGALLELDRSDYYAPTNIYFYARHYFDGKGNVQGKKPNPVKSYSSY